MTAEAPRCSTTSLSLGEPELATASTVSNWFLIEQPGPWGYRALDQSRLPGPVARELGRRARRAGVRVILIRQRGRSQRDFPEGLHGFLAHVEPGWQWLEHVRLQEPEEALDIDLRRVRRRTPPHAGQVERAPLFLVCTNGRRDPCCAERGRVLARVASEAFGERVWECSHIGGDRFAGNVVCFPHGLYFGRVRPEDVGGVAGGYRDGRIELDRFRGRCCLPFPAQAAEHFTRRELGLDGVDDLRLVGHERLSPRVFRSDFAAPEGPVSVTVGAGPAFPRRLTCHSDEPLPPPAYRLMGLSAASGAERGRPG